MSEPINIMQARKVRRLAESGLTNTAIAERLGITRRTVYNILTGKGLAQQHQRADRAESLCGGVLGPGSGNYRTQVIQRDGDQVDRLYWETGYHELTSPDPLDILIAEEEINERLQEQE